MTQHFNSQTAVQNNEPSGAVCNVQFKNDNVASCRALSESKAHPFTNFTTEKETFFAVEKAAFDQMRRITDAFEQSIARIRNQSKFQVMKKKVLKKMMKDNLLQ